MNSHQQLCLCHRSPRSLSSQGKLIHTSHNRHAAYSPLPDPSSNNSLAPFQFHQTRATATQSSLLSLPVKPPNPLSSPPFPTYNLTFNPPPILPLTTIPSLNLSKSLSCTSLASALEFTLLAPVRRKLTCCSLRFVPRREKVSERGAGGAEGEGEERRGR